MRKSFTRFFSLLFVFCLLSVTSLVYADEAQETVELYAGTTTACYNESNEYVVNVSVRDFIRLTKFDLELNYPVAFGYTGYTALAGWTGGGTLTITETTNGKISFKWEGPETTIGNNVATPIFQLKFNLDNYPALTADSFSGALTWAKKDFWYTLPDLTYDDVNTEIAYNGSLNVTQSYPVATIETSFVSETCSGGLAKVRVTSPAGLLYSFNGGAFTTDNEFGALPGNNVTIKVKDTNGCVSHPKTVAVPLTIDPISFTVTSTNPTCPGGDASVFVYAVGGTEPYTYYYNTSESFTGAVARDNFQFNVPTSTTATTYYIGVKDANGCDAATWTSVIVQDTNPVVTLAGGVSTNVSCFGGNDGAASVAITPAAEYWVSLNGGSWVKTTSGGLKTFTGLMAGTHTVTAKTVSDCTISGNAVFTIAQPDAMALAIVIDDTSCGGLNDGTVSVTVTGGTAPYIYTLSAGTWSETKTSSDPVIFTGLEPIYYSLSVKDAGNCTINYSNPNGTGNVIAVQSPADIAFTIAAVDPACYGGTGTITITATGGTGSYLYSIDNGTTSQTSNTFAVSPGTYSVTVQNRNGSGCEVAYPTATVITAKALFTATIGSTLSPTCASGTDGNITVNLGGGKSPFRYSVNNGPWINNASSPILIAVPVGTHTITVEDSSCQSVVLTETITQKASTITATTDHEILCNGSKDGKINVTVTSWAGDRTGQVFKYASAAADVYTSAGVTFIPGNGTGTPTTFLAGTYYVGAIDAYGCKANVVTVEIKQKNALVINSATVTAHASCFNTFDGVIAISAQGGNTSNTTTDAIQYAIVNEGVTTIPSAAWMNMPNYNTTTKVFSVNVQVGKGRYQVAVRDRNCSKVVLHTVILEVNGYDQLLVDETKIVKADPLCNGQANGSISVPVTAVTGGSLSYTYTLLKNGVEVVGKIDQTTGVFGGLASGTYTVKVEDVAGCPSYTTSATITLTEPELLAFTVVKKHISCNGANDGLITINVTGGTHSDTSAATQYKFAVNNQNSWQAFAGSSKQYVATQPGTYTIWVKDANECTTASQTVTISQPATVSATVTVTNATCYGTSTGSILISNVTGGWTGSVYQYKVNSGAMTATGTPTTTVSNLPAGNHTLTVYALKASDGDYQTATCTVTIPFTITQPERISYDVAISNVKCKGGNDGSLTVTVLGGGTASTTGGYSVQVTGPNYNTTSWTGTDKVHTFTGMTTGLYTVRITDNRGCTLSTTIGDSAAPYYTVESWEVQEPATALAVSATRISNVKCNGAADGVFTIAAAGGVAPYKFFTAKSLLPDHIILPDPNDASAWMSVEGSTYTKTNATAGTWIVWAQDANGCIIGGEDLNGVPVNAWRVQITEPNPITFDLGAVVSPTCNGSSNGSITVTNIAGGTASYTVTVIGTSKAGAVVNVPVTKNLTSITVPNLPASDGFYTIQVTDVNGCVSATATRTVNEPAALTVTLATGDGSFTCPGSVEGWLDATATGGTAPYKYRLYKNGSVFVNWQPVSAFFVQIGHTYKVEVQDKNGDTGFCSAFSADLAIDEPDPVVATLHETTCYGDPSASIVVKATGDEGRTFSIRYRLNTGTYPTTWTAMPNGELAISGLLFSNVNVGQNFYFFQIRDNKGCMTELVDQSFVPTQHPLQATLVQEDLNASVTITGGISPYTYQVGTAAAVTLPVDGDEFQVVNLMSGSTTITVWDAHMCMVAQAVTVAPLTVTAVPASGNNQPNMFDVELTFNRDVVAGSVNSSTLTVSSTTGTPTVTITGSGKVFKASVAGDDLAAITLALTNGIMDVAGNTLTATSFMYTIGDHVAPTLVVTPPATPVATVFTVGLEFSEPVSGLLDKTGIAVTGGTILDVTGVGGKTYSLTVSSTEQTLVTIVLSNVIKDLSLNANAFAGQTLTYTTGDFTKPALVTWTPNDVTIADNHPMLKMTFSENVMVGAGGELKIYKVATTTPALTIPITAAMINGKDVTVNYTTTSGLDKDTRYYVLVDGTALKDNAGNTFDGVSDQAAWTFRTGLVFATPVVEIENGSLEFKVYPNPFVEYVNVENADKLSKVVVTNIAGQTVKEVVNPAKRVQLNELRSGVYFISLYDGNTVIKTAKVIKR